MVDRLFSQILDMSITGGYVILFVLLARMVLKKLPKIYSYVLWAVVLFRLVCPWSFESSLSLLNLGEKAIEPFRSAYYVSKNIEAEAGNGEAEKSLMNEFSRQLPGRELSAQMTDENTSGQASTEKFAEKTVSDVARNGEKAYADSGSALDAEGIIDAERVLDAENVSNAGSAYSFANEILSGFSVSFTAPYIESGYTLIWLKGIGVLVAYSSVMMFRLHRLLKNAVHERDNIYLTHHLSTPFVIGVFRPRIYLPRFLTGAEKEYILLHEQTHIHRKDHLVKLLSFIVLCLHWFNPLVWAAFFLSGKDMEMSCDEAVIKKLGSEVKKDYSTTLLSFASGRPIVGGAPLAFGEGDTKERVINVLNYKKPVFWVVVIALMGIIALSVGLLANPLSDSESPDKLSLPKTAERIEINQVRGEKSVGAVVVSNQERIAQIVEQLNGSRKTKRSSVNDTPAAENYLSLQFFGGEYKKAYIYEDNGKTYIEVPYTGIYSCVNDVKDYITNVYNEWLVPEIKTERVSVTAGKYVFTYPQSEMDRVAFGETAFNSWITRYTGEGIDAKDRIADYWIENVNVVSGDWNEGTGDEYHYVVQVSYGIASDSDEFISSVDNIRGKGTFKGLYRELCVRSFGNGHYGVICVLSAGGLEGLGKIEDLENSYGYNRWLDMYEIVEFGEVMEIAGEKITFSGSGYQEIAAMLDQRMMFNAVSFYMAAAAGDMETAKAMADERLFKEKETEIASLKDWSELKKPYSIKAPVKLRADKYMVEMEYAKGKTVKVTLGLENKEIIVKEFVIGFQKVKTGNEPDFYGVYTFDKVVYLSPLSSSTTEYINEHNTERYIIEKDLFKIESNDNIYGTTVIQSPKYVIEDMQESSKSSKSSDSVASMSLILTEIRSLGGEEIKYQVNIGNTNLRLYVTSNHLWLARYTDNTADGSEIIMSIYKLKKVA